MDNTIKGTKGKFALKGKDTHVITILALMLVVLVSMLILEPSNYFTLKNARSMIFQFPEYGIISFGMMACMIAGGIDLSLVGIMNFSGVIAALIVKGMVAAGMDPVISIIVAVIAALITGAACGAFNGVIIAYFNLPAMLVTLCGLQLYTGLAYGITGGPAINGMCDEFKNIANGSIAGIPYALFIFILVLLLVVYVMNSTVFGHEIYFMGSNSTAARYSGINVFKVTVFTHLFSGMLGGISGIIITSHLNSAKSSNGATYTLLTLLIAVLGGVNPDGGKGRVAGVALAVLLLQMITNAFGLLHMDDNAKTFANGCLLIAALLFDTWIERKRAAKA